MNSDSQNLVNDLSPDECKFSNEIHKWKSHPISTYQSKLKPKDSFKNLKKPIKSFYNKQNDLINELIEVNEYEENCIDQQDGEECAVHDPCHRPKLSRAKNKRRVDEILAKTVFSINLILFIAKAVVAAMTGSLSIISSVMDSAIDLISGLIMWWTSKRMKKFNPYMYPQGRQRLEPISVIILSVIMAVTSIQLAKESITTIIKMATAGQKSPNINNFSIGIICSTIVLKIILWIVCKKFGTSESSAVLVQDSRNDVFSNSVAVLCSSLSNRLYIENLKYLDPCGAIAITIYIFIGWIKTGYENVKSLIGLTASSTFLQKMTFIAVNHHPDIQYVDTVRAFHFGINFLVEIDIVLDENMPLKETHDIGESLQKRIECLNEVERCFVHIDYEFMHDPKHEHKLV